MPRDWKPVKSSNVEAYHYDAANEHLFVRFKGGGAAYRYNGVPASVAERMAKSKSPGGFVRQSLIGNYTFDRDEDEPPAE